MVELLREVLGLVALAVWLAVPLLLVVWMAMDRWPQARRPLTVAGAVGTALMPLVYILLFTLDRGEDIGTWGWAAVMGAGPLAAASLGTAIMGLMLRRSEGWES